MAKGKRISDQKRAAVMAALLAGQGVSEVAKAHEVSKATVSRLRKGISAQKLEQVETKKRADFESLIIDYVATNLRTLKAQSEEAARPSFIRQQNASDLAVLHGVLTDKTIRILSVFEVGDGEE